MKNCVLVVLRMNMVIFFRS